MSSQRQRGVKVVGGQQVNKIMFEKLVKLVNSISIDANYGSYHNCRITRKILQEIKLESQHLRKALAQSWKDAKKARE